MTEELFPKRLTLAEKIDRLFKRGHPGGRGEYTYEEVAEGIKRMGLPTISASYLQELRTGKVDNPRIHHLESIAEFFGFTPRYFFDDQAFDEIDARLELFAAMRDNRVRQLALRLADLSPKSLRAMAQMIERARELEGLPAVEHPAGWDGVGWQAKSQDRRNGGDSG